MDFAFLANQSVEIKESEQDSQIYELSQRIEKKQNKTGEHKDQYNTYCNSALEIVPKTSRRNRMNWASVGNSKSSKLQHG